MLWIALGISFLTTLCLAVKYFAVLDDADRYKCWYESQCSYGEELRKQVKTLEANVSSCRVVIETYKGMVADIQERINR